MTTTSLTRSIGIAVCALALAACAPSSTGDSASALTIALEKSASESSDGVMQTKAMLHLTGAVTKDIDLGEILGELRYVDRASYKPSFYPNGETLAVLSAWWAGVGHEIWISQDPSTDRLIVEEILGDEGTAEEAGVCSPTGVVAEVPLPGDVVVDLQGFGEPIASSNLSFCEESQSKSQR